MNKLCLNNLTIDLNNLSMITYQFTLASRFQTWIEAVQFANVQYVNTLNRHTMVL